ncbi:MAG TPA: DUF3842 family protein [Clostridiaceae bacterium]|nr:DUF3842 family protein [Clostridiaceae bacterium]
MEKKNNYKVLVIDGQGGKIGKQIIEAIKARFDNVEVTAIGTNSIATATMIKGGADNGATGENPVVVCSRTADIIIGPVGIVIADSLLGEVTPEMALAIGRSNAVKVLIPVNKCDNIIVGIPDLSITKLVTDTVNIVEQLLNK